MENADIRQRLRQVYRGGPEVQAIAARARPFVVARYDAPVVSRLIYHALHDTCKKIDPTVKQENP